MNMNKAYGLWYDTKRKAGSGNANENATAGYALMKLVRTAQHPWPLLAPLAAGSMHMITMLRFKSIFGTMQHRHVRHTKTSGTSNADCS